MATGVIVAASLFGAYTAYQSGHNQQKIADQNRAIAYQEAANTQKQYAYEADVLREKGKRLIASNRALEGKSGFSFEGTPTWLEEATASEIDKDATAILAQGLSKASLMRSQGNIYGLQGSIASEAGTGQAASTLMQGIGNIYSLQTKNAYLSKLFG